MDGARVGFGIPASELEPSTARLIATPSQIDVLGILLTRQVEFRKVEDGEMTRWTEDQLKASVDGYISMRERISNGEKINKAQAFRELAEKHGKDEAAWTRRFGNISQVMKKLGYPTIPGVGSLPHIGKNVEERIYAMIQERAAGAQMELADETTQQELATAAGGVKDSGGFTPQNANDQRVRVLRSIVQRRGQPEFRRSLIRVYGGRCAISGCSVLDVLEAAHIFPYQAGETNDISNGLLLRADLHTLFDLRLISIDPDTMCVVVSPKLMQTEYYSLAGVPAASAVETGYSASSDALRWHRTRCHW